MTDHGYAGRILRVDLTSGRASVDPASDYAGRFLGGRGMAAGLYRDAVPPEADPLGADNVLIFATGPLCGVPVVGGSRWQVCGRSPAGVPPTFSYANLGGRWGAGLKFAGYDALVIHGCADKPVCLFIEDGGYVIREASGLWGRGAIEAREILKAELGDSVSVVAIGPAGENLAVMATLLADNDASGSAGLGAVMGSKKLKAIVVRGSSRRMRVAHPERLQEAIDYYRGLRRIMLDSSTYRFSSELVPTFGRTKMKRPDPCYGCRGCTRRLYEAADGARGKYMCASALFYQPRVVAYHGGWVEDVSFQATKLIDDWGLDSKTMDLMIGWLHACHAAGILTEKAAGLPLSRIGSLEFMEALVRAIGLRRGFGDVLARGLPTAAESLGPQAVELTQRVGYLGMPEYQLLYDPRLYIPHALFYAMEPRLPMAQLHEYGVLMPKFASWAKKRPGARVSPDVVRAIARRFWGSEAAADLSTYEGKALAVKLIQDRETAKECLILCDMIWPILDVDNSDDHVGDPTLESRILAAVTGRDMDEQGLYEVGARVFNLQRAIMVQEGHWGRDFDQPPARCFQDPLEFDQVNPDCLVPGRDGEVISRKGAVLDRGEFERMKSEYYRIRGWDVDSGLQTKASLKALDLADVAEDLEGR